MALVKRMVRFIVNGDWFAYGMMLLVGVILGIFTLVKAQTLPSYKPTEVQQLKLQVSQRDAWLAQRDFIEAQRRYQESVAALNRLGEQVKMENDWPKEVIFNADKLEFAEPTRGTARPGAPGAPGAPGTGENK